MKIRSYNPQDQSSVEEIHFDTGFLGRSMNTWLSNNKVWKKEIAYYLQKEPEGIFVLENDKKEVVGYIIGTVDDKRCPGNIHFVAKTLKNFIYSWFLPREDRLFWRSQFLVLVNIIKGSSKEKSFKHPYPAGHLHINLLPVARGKQYGSQLLKSFEQYAKSKGCTTIHADSFLTPHNKNTNFWKKNGFTVYDKVRTSFWDKQLPGEDMFLVCYQKKLE